jgi:hypothetical protein
VNAVAAEGLGATTEADGAATDASGAGASTGAAEGIGGAAGTACASGFVSLAAFGAAAPTERAERVSMNPPAPSKPTRRTAARASGNRERFGGTAEGSDPVTLVRDASLKPGIDMAAADTLEEGITPGGSDPVAVPVGSLCASHARTLSRC